MALILQWRNSIRVMERGLTDHVIEWEEHTAWFQTKDPEHLRVFQWQGQPVGVVSFSRISEDGSSGYWNFYLGYECLPKGTGTEMTTLALEYAFDELGLEEVFGEVMEDNEPSIGLHQKLGFIQDEECIQPVTKKEKEVSLLTFTLTREDWEAAKEEEDELDSWEDDFQEDEFHEEDF